MLTSPNMFGAPVDPEMARERQAQWPKMSAGFADESTALWRQALALQSQWRNGYSEELWAAELTAMPDEVQKAVADNAELARAKQLIQQFETVSAGDEAMPGLASWVQWYLPISRSDPALNAAITRLYQRFAPRDQSAAPPGFQPELAGGSEHRPLITLFVQQLGGRY